MEAAAIAEVLGGTAVLGKKIETAEDLESIIRKGLPAKAVTVLGKSIGMGNEVVVTLHIPFRTMARRLSTRSRLTQAESDRAVRLARVFATATRMIGDENKAAAWLRRPNRALGGKSPMERLDTDIGTHEVEEVLGRIAYGVHS